MGELAMRKTVLITLSALLALVSCTREQAMPEDIIKGKVTFKASIVETKTHLGDKEGTSWPNYWSESDAISVNGVISEPLDASFDGSATAQFTVEGIAAPFNAAYPASAVSDYANGSATITIPDEQLYVDGSYDPDAYIMLGKASGESLSFAPQMAIFSITPTGTDAQIKSISLTSLGGKKIAGAFTTDFESLTAADGALSTVTVSAFEGIDLGEPWMILIPASDFTEDGIMVVITDTNNGVMTRTTTPSKAYAAGKMYSATIPYSPDPLSIVAEGITSSTAIICWNTSHENGYTIDVCSDSECATVIDSYTVDAGDSCWGEESPRFCVSGLDPSTTYYVKVTDDTNNTESNILPVTTKAFTVVEVSSTPAAVGDVILAEDFGELRWDCDVVSRGVGYFPTSQDSFSNTEVNSYQQIKTSNEKVLSSQSNALADSRLAHWAQGANPNLYIHPGYIKLVGSKKVTHVVTPALDNIPDGMLATLEVEVTASAYYSESDGKFTTTSAVVAVQPAGAYNELVDETKTNVLDLTTNIAPITLDEATAWKTYKVTLTGVGKGARLAFGAAADVTQNDARMNLSDMKVTITALEEPGITASCKSVSSSTAVFTWTYGGGAAEDIAKPYTIALYSDSECTNLVVSFDIPADDSCWNGKVPCFVFGGLNPSTEYWFVVTDTDADVSSDPVSATTDAFTVVDPATLNGSAAVGDVILAEDFSEIGWGSDEVGGAVGFVPSHKDLAIPGGANPEGSFRVYNVANERIFGAGVDLGTSRISSGWGFFGNSSVYIHNGCFRVSAKGKESKAARTHLVTPALSGIPAGKIATIEVTVTATKYDPIQIAVFAEKGMTMNETSDPSSANYKKYTGASLSDGHAFDITTTRAWETKSVTISNVDAECQLVIGSLENYNDPSDGQNKNRFFISDVKVQITALADDPVMKIKDDATFNAFVSAVATDKTVPGIVSQSFTVSSETAEAFASIEDYEGVLDGNGKTITGLTKPLFNELKGTVKDLSLNSKLNITEDQLDMGILANVLSGTADGCTSQGSVTFNVADGVSGEHHVGGMFGQAASGSTVTDCTNEATVYNETSYASGNENELMVGGVLGTFWGAQFTISGCTNTGEVVNYGDWNKDVSIGGIIGQAGNGSSSSSDLSVTDCTNSGDVANIGNCNDATNNVGGVIGWIRFGTYTGNSNSGEVSNAGNAKQNRVGGVIGYLDKNATLDDNSNAGAVSNSGAATDINYLGGILGRMQTDNTFMDNSNSGEITNSGDATNYVYIGGIVAYLDKNNKISNAGDSAKYKLTNSGDIENSGSAKNICIGGLFGRNSSGYFNMTGSSSKYSFNSGNILDNSGSTKSDGGDLSIGGIAGYTTTGIKTQYARNTGSIYVTGDKGNTSVNVGGIGGWISNASFNFNNCRNTGDVTIDCTTTASIWAAGIVGCPKPNTTVHYYWRSSATIDTHAATVGGENYTAGLMGTVEGTSANTFTMYGHRLAGTVWGSTTTTGLFCCTKTNACSFSFQGGTSNPNRIAPGTVRKDNSNDDTVDDIDNVTIDILAGGAGSTYDISSAIESGQIVVEDW